MLIIHRMAQLGIATQKPPESWVSHPTPRRQTDDLASVSMRMYDHTLQYVLHSGYDDTSTGIVTNLHNHLLRDINKATRTTDDLLQVTTRIDDHTLRDAHGRHTQSDDLTQVTAGLGNHKLYSNILYSELLDEDHVQLNAFIGDHKLYER